MEMLEQLMAKIRRPRQRMQYSPMSETGGDNPGMRGALNALDTQAMTDRAQGIDISSVVPPTRLASADMDDVYGQQEAPAADAPGPTIRLASAPQQSQAYRIECGPGGCRRVPVMQSQSQALPEGVTLGPGESFVPGSLREVPSGQAAPTPQPAAPQQAPAQAAAPQAAAKPSVLDDQMWMSRGDEHIRRARAAIGMRDAVTSRTETEFAKQALNIGIAAATLKAQQELHEASQTNVKRSLDLQQQELEIKSGAFAQNAEQKIRSDVTKPSDERVREILARRMAARSQIPGFVMNEDAAKKEEAMERGIIAAQDTSFYLEGYLSALDEHRAAAGAGQDANPAYAKMRLIDGKMRQLLSDRYSTLPTPEARRQAIEGELGPVYINVYQKRMAGEDGQANAAQVQSAVLTKLTQHRAALERMIADPVNETPYKYVFPRDQEPQPTGAE
jgi:hypothetical protein